MTLQERATHAARWRRIARKHEKIRDEGEAGLCWAALEENEPNRYREVFGGTPGTYAFRRNRRGNDCRVIAAGLIAAMYETGEFDA
jgi:hypothetical protein